MNRVYMGQNNENRHQVVVPYARSLVGSMGKPILVIFIFKDTTQLQAYIKT